MGEQLIGGSLAGVGTGELARAVRRLLTPDPRALVDAVRNGEWRSPFVGEPRRRLMRQLQATMAVVEGYSEHVMDAVGGDARRGLPRAAPAARRGRAERGRSRRSSRGCSGWR